MTSTQITHPPPTKPALLNTSNLELLTTHEKNRVQEFVASQSRYAKAQANEGRAVRASWDIGTPEKDKMRLHQPSAGFETPILKPRAAQIRPEPYNPPSSPPRLKSPANRPSTSRQSPALVRKAKATPAIREMVSPKRQNRSGKKSTEKKSGTSKPTRKERRARSDTDEEQLARLTERRERKRVKQAIMNTREDRAGTRGEKENKKDTKNEPNEKKKHRIPAGLALMHGFSSTNVGKSRLTMEPPPNFGVFNKGKASVKIKVDESKCTKQRGFRFRVFSEDRFLDTRPAKSPGERLVSQTSSDLNSSNEPSSLVKTRNSATVQLQKASIETEPAGRRQRAASVQCDSETANSYASRAVGVRKAKSTDQAEPMASRSPAHSISWVIEQDGYSLPSTTSDLAITSVRSKPETAHLDVRAAAWSKILKNGLPGGNAVFNSEPQENPQATPIIPSTTVLQGITSNAHLEPEELATIGPWESASQVARNTVYRPQELGSVHSRYFALPQYGESGFTQPMIHLANDPLSQLAGIDGACSSNARDTAMDGPQVHEETGVDHRGGDVSRSAPANASSGNNSSEERISASQTPSLDSVDHAVLPDVPGVTRRRSRIRRRPVPWHRFDSTAENMLFQQYGLDPNDTHCMASQPFLHGQDDSKTADASNSLLGDPITVSNTQDSTPGFCGEDNTEGLEGNSEDQNWNNEWFSAIVSDSQEFVGDVVFTPQNATYDCRGGAPFLVDSGYEGVNEIEEDSTGFASVSIPSADGSIFLEDDAGEMMNIRLWNDEAWAQGDAIRGNTLQEGCSYLTSVQRVEQDVAKKLKDHWFPQKF